MKMIKIDKDIFKNLEYKMNVPTFECSCRQEILDTPDNRLLSNEYETEKNS